MEGEQEGQYEWGEGRGEAGAGGVGWGLVVQDLWRGGRESGFILSQGKVLIRRVT